MSKEPQRSKVGTTISFGCGAVAGLLIGFWGVTTAAVNSVTLFVAGVVLAGTLGGVLAVRFGRRFWETLGRLRWFVP